jgi:ubiquitin carboxyl-terminal hydrolase 8
MFGGPDQQDASEFLLFLFDNLHEETNTHRNIEGQLSQQPNTKNKTILQAAEEYWGNYLTSNYSVVDRYWRGLDLSTVCCQVCKTKTHTFGVFDTLILYLRDGPPMTLATALDHYAAPNTISDFQCDSCKAPTLASQSSCIARMPRLLCMVLNRAAQGGKTSKMVTWDLNDFDFAPWFMKPTDANGRQQVSSPWRYECYAIVVHKGSTMYSGHYYTFVRDPNTSGSSSWLQFNDTHVSKVPDMSRVQRDWLGGTPFLLLFRRK